MKVEKGKIETTVYRKPTNNNIYIHWNSYGPKQWKVGTLSGIIRRAYVICSTVEARSTELKFIEKGFTDINGYPKYLVKNMLKKFEEAHKNETGTVNNSTEN